MLSTLSPLHTLLRSKALRTIRTQLALRRERDPTWGTLGGTTEDDANASGRMTASAVHEWLYAMLAAEKEKVLDLFRQLDKDYDDRVDMDEFVRAVAALGLKGDGVAEASAQLFASYDLDGDGRLVYAELWKHLRRRTRGDGGAPAMALIAAEPAGASAAACPVPEPASASVGAQRGQSRGSGTTTSTTTAAPTGDEPPQRQPSRAGRGAFGQTYEEAKLPDLA